MKLLAAVFLLLDSLAASAEDMQAYLRQTQTLVQRGQHKQALERMIWFHGNALRQDPSIYTTRLTVALDGWTRLAGFYPPAKKALVTIRDRNETRILANGGSRLLFHELVAINRSLGEPEKSLTVFRQVHNDHPKQAKQYWPLVKDVILKERDLQLASAYVTDVPSEFETVKKAYQRQREFSSKRTGTKTEIERTEEALFVADARLLIELAMVTNDSENVIKMQEEALELIDDPALEKALTEGLPNVPEALPPAEDPPLLDE